MEPLYRGLTVFKKVIVGFATLSDTRNVPACIPLIFLGIAFCEMNEILPLAFGPQRKELERIQLFIEIYYIAAFHCFQKRHFITFATQRATRESA